MWKNILFHVFLLQLLCYFCLSAEPELKLHQDSRNGILNKINKVSDQIVSLWHKILNEKTQDSAVAARDLAGFQLTLILTLPSSYPAKNQMLLMAKKRCRLFKKYSQMTKLEFARIFGLSKELTKTYYRRIDVLDDKISNIEHTIQINKNISAAKVGLTLCMEKLELSALLKNEQIGEESRSQIQWFHDVNGRGDSSEIFCSSRLVDDLKKYDLKIKQSFHKIMISGLPSDSMNAIPFVEAKMKFLKNLPDNYRPKKFLLKKTAKILAWLRSDSVRFFDPSGGSTVFPLI